MPNTQFTSDGGRATNPALVDLDRLMPVFERLVDETVAQVLACPAKPDPTFSGFEDLLAPIRSATTLEGMLLERGIEAICQCRDDLTIIPLENPLPVIPEARAFLRRNDWGKASALRLGADVHTREFYRPDLLVVDADSHRALSLAVLLAGRRAEIVIVGQALSGAGGASDSDLARATALALSLETSLGFGRKHPLVYRPVSDAASQLAYDPELARHVDARLEEADAIATIVIEDHTVALTELATDLVRHGTLEGETLRECLERMKKRLKGWRP